MTNYSEGFNDGRAFARTEIKRLNANLNFRQRVISDLRRQNKNLRRQLARKK